ncbi:MAG: PfkB family carbohydrate kinase [Acidobacteriota bacterium]|nr:PfkB family carbohydrate kinase [Acidobacteriota bacterium]
MERERLDRIVGRFPSCRIAVLGDFFLDKYLDVEPTLAEVSVESGKTAHQVMSIRCSAGAAGTIVNNLASLDAGEIHVFGVTGDDGEAYDLRKALDKLGCRREGLLSRADLMTPTYLKPRDRSRADLSGEHERYDTKNHHPLPAEIEDEILKRLESLLPRIDAVIIQDQIEEEDCGVVTTRVRDGLGEMARRNPEKIFWADSRCRIRLFRNIIIKVNAREAVQDVFVPGQDEGDDLRVVKAIGELRQRAGRPVFVTAGRRGIWVSDPEPSLVRGVRIPEPTDPTGAGDSVNAGGVLALCAGADLREAALVANLVGSITVQQLATTGTARPDELGPRLEMWRGQG